MPIQKQRDRKSVSDHLFTEAERNLLVSLDTRVFIYIGKFINNIRQLIITGPSVDELAIRPALMSSDRTFMVLTPNLDSFLKLTHYIENETGIRPRGLTSIDIPERWSKALPSRATLGSALVYEPSGIASGEVRLIISKVDIDDFLGCYPDGHPIYCQNSKAHVTRTGLDQAYEGKT